MALQELEATEGANFIPANQPELCLGTYFYVDKHDIHEHEHHSEML